MELRRRLYRRGSSFETTIPRPLLFALDMAKKHEVVFSYDGEDGTTSAWRIHFEETGQTGTGRQAAPATTKKERKKARKRR